MAQVHGCSVCGRNDVRLYRYGGMFLRDEEIFCRADAPSRKIEGGNLIPLIEDTDGSVWGYTSAPEDAMKRFYAMPDGV